MKKKYTYSTSQIIQFLLICLLSTVISGCSEFLGTQPPAPVYGGNSGVINKTPVVQAKPIPEPVQQVQQAAQNTQDTVKTEPLKLIDSKITPVEIKPEPVPLESQLNPEKKNELSSSENQQTTTTTEQKTETVTSIPEEAPAPPPPPPPPPVFVPLESFGTLSPVVGSLVVAANKNSDSGNIDSATTTIERAIRIEPRNAVLYYKLALLRLKQRKPKLAEDLAKKSAQLAGKDVSLKKHSWLLVAEAREKQNDTEGAKEAREKADKF